MLILESTQVKWACNVCSVLVCKSCSILLIDVSSDQLWIIPDKSCCFSKRFVCIFLSSCYLPICMLYSINLVLEQVLTCALWSSFCLASSITTCGASAAGQWNNLLAAKKSAAFRRTQPPPLLRYVSMYAVSIKLRTYSNCTPPVLLLLNYRSVGGVALGSSLLHVCGGPVLVEILGPIWPLLLLSHS